VKWQGAPLAWLDGTGPRDEATLSTLAPLLAWALIHRERERALERASRYERVFALSDTLVVVGDACGLIEEASPSWEHQLGWTPAELKGRAADAVMHPEAPADLLSNLRQKLDAGQPAGAVTRIKAKSGELALGLVDGDARERAPLHRRHVARGDLTPAVTASPSSSSLNWAVKCSP
jgi:PAS domain S-box-containing protein